MFVDGDLTPLSRKCLISASGETRGLSDLRGGGVSQQSRGGMCRADLEPLQRKPNSNFKEGNAAEETDGDSGSWMRVTALANGREIKEKDGHAGSGEVETGDANLDRRGLICAGEEQMSSARRGGARFAPWAPPGPSARSCVDGVWYLSHGCRR